jgi:hypothetical protein
MTLGTTSRNQDYAPPAMFMWSWLNAWANLQEVMNIPAGTILSEATGQKLVPGSHEWWEHHFDGMSTDLRHMTDEERARHLSGVRDWASQQDPRSIRKMRPREGAKTPPSDSKLVATGKDEHGKTIWKRFHIHPDKDPETGEKHPHAGKPDMSRPVEPSYTEPEEAFKKRKARHESGERHDGTDLKSLHHMSQALNRLSSSEVKISHPKKPGEKIPLKDIMLSARSRVWGGKHPDAPPSEEMKTRGIKMDLGDGREVSYDARLSTSPKADTDRSEKPFKPTKAQAKRLAALSGEARESLLSQLQARHQEKLDADYEKRHYGKGKKHFKDKFGEKHAPPSGGWSEENPHPQSTLGRLKAHRIAKGEAVKSKGTQRDVMEPEGGLSSALANLMGTSVAGHGEYHHHDAPDAVHKAMKLIDARKSHLSTSGKSDVKPEERHGTAWIAQETGISEDRVRSMIKGYSVVPMRDLARQAKRHVAKGGKLDDAWVAKAHSRLLSLRASSKKAKKKEREVGAYQAITGAGGEKETDDVLAALQQAASGKDDERAGELTPSVSSLGARLGFKKAAKDVRHHPGDEPEKDASDEAKAQHAKDKARHEATASLLGLQPKSKIGVDKAIEKFSKMGLVRHPGEHPGELPEGASAEEKKAHEAKVAAHADQKAKHARVANALGLDTTDHINMGDANHISKLLDMPAMDIERKRTKESDAMPAARPSKSVAGGKASGSSVRDTRETRKVERGEEEERLKKLEGGPVPKGTGAAEDEPGKTWLKKFKDSLHEVFPLTSEGLRKMPAVPKEREKQLSLTTGKDVTTKRPAGFVAQTTAHPGEFNADDHVPGKGKHAKRPRKPSGKRATPEAMARWESAVEAWKKDKADHASDPESYMARRREAHEARAGEWDRAQIERHGHVHKVLGSIADALSDPQHELAQQVSKAAAETKRLAGRGEGRKAKKQAVSATGEELFDQLINHHAGGASAEAFGADPKTSIRNAFRRVGQHGKSTMARAISTREGGKVAERRPSGWKQQGGKLVKDPARTQLPTAPEPSEQEVRHKGHVAAYRSAKANYQAAHRTGNELRIKQAFDRLKKARKTALTAGVPKDQLSQPKREPGQAPTPIAPRPTTPAPEGGIQEPLSSQKRRLKLSRKGVRPVPPTTPVSQVKPEAQRRSAEAEKKAKADAATQAQSFASKVKTATRRSASGERSARAADIVPLAGHGRQKRAEPLSGMQLPRSTSEIGGKQTGKKVKLKTGSFGSRVGLPQVGKKGEQEPTEAGRFAQRRGQPAGTRVSAEPAEPSAQAKKAKKAQDAEMERVSQERKRGRIAKQMKLTPTHQPHLEPLSFGTPGEDPVVTQPFSISKEGEKKKGIERPGRSMAPTASTSRPMKSGRPVPGETTRAQIGPEAVKATPEGGVAKMMGRIKGQKKPRDITAFWSKRKAEKEGTPPTPGHEERRGQPTRSAAGVPRKRTPGTWVGKAKPASWVGKKPEGGFMGDKPKRSEDPSTWVGKKPEQRQWAAKRPRPDAWTKQNPAKRRPKRRPQQGSKGMEQGRPGEQKGNFERGEGGDIKRAEESLLSRSTLSIHESSYFGKKTSLFDRACALA